MNCSTPGFPVQVIDKYLVWESWCWKCYIYWLKNSTESLLTKFFFEGVGYSNTINLYIFVLVLRPEQFEIHHPTVVEMRSDSDSFPTSETEWKTRAGLHNSSHKSQMENSFKWSAGTIIMDELYRREAWQDAWLWKEIQCSPVPLSAGEFIHKETLHVHWVWLMLWTVLQPCSPLNPHREETIKAPSVEEIQQQYAFVTCLKRNLEIVCG